VIKFKPPSEMGFENSQKSSKVTGQKNLFTTGGNVSNERETTKIDEVQKQGTHSALHFVFCFNSISYLALRYKNGCTLLSECPL
jgi:hypothetical protein